jgi:hypothetical protein
MTLQQIVVQQFKQLINLQNNRNMKKIVILFAFISVGLFNSCSDSSGDKFGGDYESGWVQFVNGTAANFVFAPGAVYKVPIQLNSPVNVSGLDVSYTITDVVGTSAGKISFTPKVTYASGTNMGGEVVLTVTAPTLAQSIEFDVTLTATSRSNVQVGLGNNEKPVKKRIKICSLGIASSYVGASTALLATPSTFTPWSPIITPVVGEPNKFNFNTCWGLGFVQSIANAPAGFNYPGVVTINANNTVTVVGINAATSPNRYPGGTGTFDPCTKVITYTLNQGLFSNPFQVRVVLTPN